MGGGVLLDFMENSRWGILSDLIGTVDGMALSDIIGTVTEEWGGYLIKLHEGKWRGTGFLSTIFCFTNHC